MRVLQTLFAAALAASAHAQDWTKDDAVAEIHELVLTRRPMEDWAARRQAIGVWLTKVDETEIALEDHAFLVGVARYFTMDYGGAADALLAELERLGAVLPTSDFDMIVGRALMADGVRTIREGDLGRARRCLSFALRFYSDPAMVYRVSASALARAEGVAAAELLDETLREMFGDERLDVAKRQAILKAVYGPRASGGGGVMVLRSRGASLKPIVAKDLDGNDVSLEALKGKVVLVDFWATWCSPCIREMPNVVAAQREYGDQGFVVLGISLDQEPSQKRGGPVVEPDPDGAMVAKIRSTMERLGMDWTVVYEGGGWESRLAKENGIRSIPATFLLDRTGKVRFTNLRGEKLALRVGELLKEE